jgi:hypothetical protein
MGSFQKSQNGFGAVETLVVLLIIGLIGFAGWAVFSKDSDAKNETVTQKSSQSSKAEIDIPDDWQQFVSKDKTVKFAYPKAWGVLNEQTQEQSEASFDTENFVQPIVITEKQNLLIQVPKSFADYSWYLWDKDTDTLVVAEDVKHPDDPQMLNYHKPVELGSTQKIETIVDDGRGNAVFHVLGKGAQNCGARHYFFDVKDKVIHIQASLCDKSGELEVPDWAKTSDVVETPLKDIYKYIAR